MGSTALTADDARAPHGDGLLLLGSRARRRCARCASPSTATAASSRFASTAAAPKAGATRNAARIVAAQLGEYFAGKRREFDLDLAPYGTDFQLRVWQALRAIPYGAVRNYGDIARAIGQPGAARAVGQANGCNPLPIVIPCHRVIASDGTIGGYSGGLAIKHRLLALEGAELDL